MTKWEYGELFARDNNNSWTFDAYITKCPSVKGSEASGDRNEAMGMLAEAFHELYHPRAYGMQSDVPLGFGRSLSWRRRDEVRTALQSLRGDTRKPAHHLITPVAAQIADTAEAAAKAQVALRVMTLGIDYPRYLRFQQLAPAIVMSINGKVDRVYYDGYAPSEEHFQTCLNFIVEVALRIAELTADLDPPPWLKT